MTIDPRLYEKYSGRSGDPYSRMGAALAGSAARKSKVKASKDRSFSERLVIGHIYAQIAKIVVLPVILLVAFVLMKIFG